MTLICTTATTITGCHGRRLARSQWVVAIGTSFLRFAVAWVIAWIVTIREGSDNTTTQSVTQQHPCRKPSALRGAPDFPASASRPTDQDRRKPRSMKMPA